MDATVSSILAKSAGELKSLWEHGVRHLYIGIETGLNDVLLFMRKEHNLEQAYAAVYKLKEAGLIFDAHIMTGIAGKGRGLENAEALAEFFDRTQPTHIVNFSLFLDRTVPLWRKIEEGLFYSGIRIGKSEGRTAFSETLSSHLPPPGQAGESSVTDGFHDLISVRVRGALPDDREKMLKKLSDEISRQQEKQTRRT